MLVRQQSDYYVDYYEENQGHAEHTQGIFNDCSRHCCLQSHLEHNRIGPKSSIPKLGFDVRNKAPAV